MQYLESLGTFDFKREFDIVYSRRPSFSPGLTFFWAEDILLTDIAKLSVSDETPIEVETTASGSYSGKAKNGGYSPGAKQM
jgi:hypothetical protein